MEDVMVGVGDNSNGMDEVMNAVMGTNEIPNIVNANTVSTNVTGLEDYLKTTGEGKLILQSYHINSFLTKTLRSRLVRLIVKRELDRALRTIQINESLQKFQIKTERLIAYAKDIERIFDGELASVYFTPATTSKNVSIPATGKLWDHYNYKKDTLRQSGHLQQKSQSEKQNLVISDEENDMLQWLEVNVEPHDTLVNFWTRTNQIRRFTYLADGESISDYFSNFLCLRLSVGTELLSLDFNCLYGEKENILHERWPAIRSCLIKELEQRIVGEKRCKNVEDLAAFRLLKTDLISEAPGRSADEVLIGEVDIALRGDADDAGSPRSNPEATSSQPFASKCIVDGKAYSHSQMIPSEDQSSHCLCVAGEVYCWWQTFGGSSAKAAGSSALDNNELLLPASQPLDKAEEKEEEDDDEKEEDEEDEEEEDYSAEGSSELPPEASGESAAAGEQLDDNSVDSDERSDAAEEDDEEDEEDEEEDELEESNDVPQAAISNLTTSGSLASTTSTSTTMPGATSAKPTVAPATCLFMGRTYRPGEPLPHSTGNCVECRCGIDGHIECSPRDCVGLRPQRPGGGDLELFDGASNF